MPRAQKIRQDEEAGVADNSDLAPVFRVDEPLGYFIRRAQVAVFQQFKTHYADLQLRPVEFSILTLILNNPGRKQTEIAQALGIKRANFVPIIDGLEGRNFVERRPSAEDRRANALYLTPVGAKFIQNAHKRHDALESAFTMRLGGPAKR